MAETLGISKVVKVLGGMAEREPSEAKREALLIAAICTAEYYNLTENVLEARNGITARLDHNQRGGNIT